MRMPRLLSKGILVVAAAVSALILVAPASAGYWESGWFYLSTHSTSMPGNCYWYPDRSGCSGWNYWSAGTCYWQYDSDYMKALCGYESSVHIRGQWFYNNPGGEIIDGPSDYSMGGQYVHKVATYWEGYQYALGFHMQMSAGA